MLSILARLFGRRGGDKATIDMAKFDSEYSWMYPPAELRDPEAWDVFWQKHIEHKLMPPIYDMFVDNRELISAIREKGMTRILCAASGLLIEPRTLAKAGFEVVALDISAWALEFVRLIEIPEAGYEQLIGRDLWSPGGSVEYVVGDILDPNVCPGPFDVIIERRTAQDYQNDERDAVLQALANRLQEQGVFVSHCHDSRGGPGRKTRRFTEPWFKSNGWKIRRGRIGKLPSSRIALIEHSTG